MDETALLQLLALLLQTVLIIMPMHLTSFEYLRLLSLEYCHFSPHFRMMPPQRFFASCMIFYPLDLHLCSDLFDNVPWPGGGGVPQVSPGLEAAISILLCPPTNHVHHTGVPILVCAIYAEEGKCGPQVSPGMEAVIYVLLCTQIPYQM